MKFASAAPTPEQEVATAQSHVILEEAILSLPDSYRTVLMMRDIEELTTAEAAESLDITEQNVKVRLHRAVHCCAESFMRVPAPAVPMHSPLWEFAAIAS